MRLVRVVRPNLSLIALSACFAWAQPGSVYEQSAAEIQGGRAAAAIRVLDARLKENPQDLKALTLMGMALLAENHSEEGNRYFQKALQVNPTYAPALRNLAMSQLAMGQASLAVATFPQLIQQTPADAGARLGLAQAYVGLGDREKAGEVLERMPGTADAGTHFAAGNLLAGMERYGAAAREFELAQDGYPNPYDAGFNLMLAYVKLQQYPSALRTGELLVSRGYRQPELYNLLAQSYEGVGKTAQAYEALRTATNLDTGDPTNYLDLIALCLTHGNYDLALEIADIAIARLPKSERVRLQRGIVLAMKENFDGARADFEKAVALAPDAAVPHVALALMLLQMDRSAEAVALLRKRVETGGDYLSLWFLGEALNRAGLAAGSSEEGESVAVLTRSIAANPNVPQSQILLAKLLARRGELDAAEKHLSRALQLEPENVSATYQLAQVYQKKGDSARARQLFAKVSKAKAEDREQFTRGGLQHIIRAGSK